MQNTLKKILVIAEAGVNHNGCVETAKRLILAAAKSGADAVKFQIYKTDSIVSRSAKKAEYQLEPGRKESQYEMLKRLELSYADFKILKQYACKNGIMFLATPFDVESFQFLVTLNPEFIKISSGEVVNLPFLKMIGNAKKRVILSTGMSTLEEVDFAYRTLKNNGCPETILLHCTSNYPASYKSVNLRAMITLKNKFGCRVGYSDHTIGKEVAVAAAAMGASVIEKHLTLKKSMKGPDHKASSNPSEFAEMTNMIRNVEQAMGSENKKPSRSEYSVLAVARKSIVAGVDIIRGDIIVDSMLAFKRPGTGISPADAFKLIGKMAKRNIRKDTLLQWGDFYGNSH